jgi:hypothetical protein
MGKRDVGVEKKLKEEKAKKWNRGIETMEKINKGRQRREKEENAGEED